jgi:glutamine cyclotransferase
MLPIALLIASAGTVGSSREQMGASGNSRVVRGFPSPGDKPEGLAWDGRYLWCNNFTDGTLYKIDPTDGSVVARYQGQGLPSAPEGLAWDGEHLWTAHWHTGIIYKMRETVTGMEIVQEFDKPQGAGSTVGLGWDGTSVWLSCWPSPDFGGKAQLFELDPKTLEVRNVRLLPVLWIEDLAWDGRWFWSADWLNSVAFALDPATGDTLHSFASPGPNPVGTAWDGTHLWMTDTTRDSIWALDISDVRTSAQSTSWTRFKALFRPNPR